MNSWDLKYSYSCLLFSLKKKKKEELRKINYSPFEKPKAVFFLTSLSLLAGGPEWPDWVASVVKSLKLGN